MRPVPRAVCLLGVAVLLVASACTVRGAPERCSREDPSCYSSLASRVRSANPGRAAELYGRGCEAGDARACTSLGVMLFGDEGIPRDHPAAAHLFEKACDAGDGMGCGWLGMVYQHGIEWSRDFQRAADNYQKACKQTLHFCEPLADLVDTGRAELRPPMRPAELYRRACRTKEEYCAKLGGMLLHGKGVARDVPGALDAFETGCDEGSGESCAEAGRMDEQGIGTELNWKAAELRYERGCYLKNARACAALARLHSVGRSDHGVPQDWSAAAEWWEEACKLGDVGSCSSGEAARDRMTERRAP